MVKASCPTVATRYGARSSQGRISRRFQDRIAVGEGVRVRVGDLVAVGRRVGVIVGVALGVNVAVGVAVQALCGGKSGGGTPRRLLISECSRIRFCGSMRSAVNPGGARRGSPQAATAGSMSQIRPGGSETTR